MDRLSAVKRSTRSKSQSAPGSKGSSRPSSAKASKFTTAPPSGAGSTDTSDTEDTPEFGKPSLWEGDEHGDRSQANGDNWEDALRQAMEDLGEKRTSTRETALDQIRIILCRRFAEPVIASRQETIIDALKRSIQKGKTQTEMIRAARALGLVYITLGPDVGMYDDLSLPFKYLISHPKKPDLQAAITSTLSMVCFVAGEGVVETLDLMHFLRGILSDPKLNDIPAAAALTSWGFLLSSLDGNLNGLPVGFTEEALEMNAAWVGSKSTEVRIAAGENAAMIHELLSPSEPEISSTPPMEEIISQLHSLSTESSKHRSKKDRSMQKAAFRDILDTIEEGNPPDASITLNHTVYPVDSWVKVRRLRVFRSFIGEGLTVHASENDVLLEMLSIADDTSHAAALGPHDGDSSGSHARIVHSANSEVAKGRSQARTKQRANRDAARMQTLD